MQVTLGDDYDVVPELYTGDRWFLPIFTVSIDLIRLRL